MQASATIQTEIDSFDSIPTNADRDTVIMRYAPLVRSIARRYAGRGMAYDDLMQTGYLGLIQAVDRFDPSRGVPLRVYAARTINGEIMHLFRDRGWAVRVPRSLQELGRRVKASSETLAHTLGRTPTVEEIAEALGETPEQVTDGMHVLRAYAAEPLVDSPSESEGDTHRGGNAIETVETGFDRTLDRDVLARAMRALGPREQRIVVLRYFDELTQSEIADQMGISQMHVSRLLRKALADMQAALEPSAA